MTSRPPRGRTWLKGSARVWRTLRPLPPSTHFFRVGNLIRKHAWRPVLPMLVRRWRRHAAATTTDPVALGRLTDDLHTAGQDNRLTQVVNDARAGSLRLAGRRVSTLPPPSWQLPQARPLERYEAHYLGWVEAWLRQGDAEDIARCWACLESWASDVTDVSAAWEPYPRARRVLHSLRAAAWLSRTPGRRARLLRRWLLEIAFTAGQPLPVLRERHLGGNHLLVDLMAESAATLATGAAWDSRALTATWRAQFRPDGSHAEGAPMYQALLVEDALTVAALAGPAWPLTRELERAVGWLKRMRQPDGSLPAYGDTEPKVLDRLPLVCRALASAQHGHTDPHWSAWTARAGSSYVTVRTGQLAWSEQPGHAHADGLSISYGFGGQPVLCDAGVSGYEGDPNRSWNRSEEAHNVVRIPEAPQLELWGTFRIGARGHSKVMGVGNQGGWQWLCAVFTWPHDAHHLQRFVALGPAGSLYVRDTITHRIPTPRAAKRRWRLHEAVDANRHDDTWMLRCKNLCESAPISLLFQTTSTVFSGTSQRHARFGETVTVQTLESELEAGKHHHMLLSATLQLDEVVRSLTPAIKSVAANAHIR